MLLGEAAAQREWNVAQTLFPASQRRALGPSETCSLVCIANHQDPRWCWWIIIFVHFYKMWSSYKMHPGCSRAIQSYGNIAPHLGDTKCPTNSMEFPFPTIKNHGSLQNARDHGYDSLQNHMPWSICTGPRLTYFVAVIPTSMLIVLFSDHHLVFCMSTILLLGNHHLL